MELGFRVPEANRIRVYGARGVGLGFRVSEAIGIRVYGARGEWV